jgi:hypothetical protein
MTVEEKVNLVMGTGMNSPGLPPNMQGPAVGETNNRVPGAAGTTFGIPRLGIPSIVLAGRGVIIPVWLAEAGTYTVKIGASSQDIRQMQTFQKAKEERVRSVSKALLPETMINEMTVKH